MVWLSAHEPSHRGDDSDGQVKTVRQTEVLHPAPLLRIDGETHYGVGVAYAEFELPDDAIYEFELAAEDPAWAFSSWRSVGRLQHVMARWEEAKRAYELALRAACEGDPRVREVTEALGLVKCKTPLPPRNPARPERVEGLSLAALVTEYAQADEVTFEADEASLRVAKLAEDDSIDRAFDEMFR